MGGYEILIIMIGWGLAGGSPGPATLAISATSMEEGRTAGLALASGVVCGSASWGIAAALGMSALMMANAWIFEIVRYAGAAYLLYLAAKSLRRVISPSPLAMRTRPKGQLFLRGLLLHLTNPKAILSWGAIYAIALPSGARSAEIWQLFAALICVSMLIFWGYAWLFSSARVARGYASLRRWFDLGFAALFGAASLRILTAKLEI